MSNTADKRVSGIAFRWRDLVASLPPELQAPAALIYSEISEAAVAYRRLAGAVFKMDAGVFGRNGACKHCLGAPLHTNACDFAKVVELAREVTNR